MKTYYWIALILFVDASETGLVTHSERFFEYFSKNFENVPWDSSENWSGQREKSWRMVFWSSVNWASPFCCWQSNRIIIYYARTIRNEILPRENEFSTKSKESIMCLRHNDEAPNFTGRKKNPRNTTWMSDTIRQQGWGCSFVSNKHAQQYRTT